MWSSFFRNASKFTKRASRLRAGGVLLASPSFLVVPSPSDTMICDTTNSDVQHSPTLSPKTQATLLLTPEHLKDSFDAFLQSIEPLICDTRMTVGVSSIPHPAKVMKGGEDAYFLSEDMKVVGVADGVGGWGDIGVDPALYSKCLVEGAKLASDESPKCRDPVDLMSSAYMYSSCVQGSSTCCILVLAGTQLCAANLGDSGFMVVRGCGEGGLETVFRTKEQQHSFNFPYQIGTGSADRPQHSQRLTVEVQPGDLIIVGTDGLWDNLFDEDILDDIAMTDSADPATIASHIARHAHAVATDKDILSPFSKSARQNGFPLATGGKLDDITVIVGKVVLGGGLDFEDGATDPMTLAP